MGQSTVPHRAWEQSAGDAQPEADGLAPQIDLSHPPVDPEIEDLIAGLSAGQWA
jgi:hypothetical protein